MTISGKIIQILPLLQGESKSTGNKWRRQDVVIQTNETYPKKVCLSFWNDTIDETLAFGNEISAEISIESREFNGKWYTDVRVRKLERDGNIAAPNASAPSASSFPPPPPFDAAFPPPPAAPYSDEAADDIDAIFGDRGKAVF
jgi:hypothetical protein